MKIIIPLIFIMFSITITGQPYLNFSFDANKLFDLKDNTRTVSDVYGLDYDIELGARDRHIGVYIFYGTFKNAGFVNYGAGVDYYVNIFENIDTSIGGAYSVIKEKDFRNDYVGVGWYHLRAVTTIWILPHFGISLRGQFQERNDISKGYVLEGSLGVSIRN